MKKFILLLLFILMGCAKNNIAQVDAITTDGVDKHITVHYSGNYSEVKIKENAINQSKKNFGKSLRPESIHIIDSAVLQ